MFEIQKQDSTRSSATGSNTNRDVDKNSDTVNLKYTKATKKRKISNVSPSPNREKSVLSVKANNNNLTSTLATLMPVGVGSTTALSTSKTGSKSKQKPTKKNDTTSKDLSYIDPDSNTNALPNFTPNRTPENHFENFQQTCNTLTKPVDFFQLFFTDEVFWTIAQHTSSYPWINIAKKQTYCNTRGAWKETDSKEIKAFIALLLYQGLVCANRIDRYWEKRNLYHGLWA